LKLEIGVLRLQLAYKASYNAVARVDFDSPCKIVIGSGNVLELVECLASEIESLKVSRFNLDKLVHELDG
jgi:hypothetical protein